MRRHISSKISAISTSLALLLTAACSSESFVSRSAKAKPRAKLENTQATGDPVASLP